VQIAQCGAGKAAIDRSNSTFMAAGPHLTAFLEKTDDSKAAPAGILINDHQHEAAHFLAEKEEYAVHP
jgi:hypothetical protein